MGKVMYKFPVYLEGVLVLGKCQEGIPGPSS